MRKKRSINSSSLAFLDVMACGLGSVILLFFILDFQENVELVSESSEENLVQNEQKISRIEELKSRKKTLSNEIKKISQQLASVIEEEVRLSIVDDSKKTTISNSQIVNSKNKPSSLIGLTVKGPRVLIILDTSASMAYSRLVDIIIGIDEKSGNYLKKGQKWEQAQNIARWLITNAPENTKLRSIGFSNKINFVDKSWQSSQAALLSFNNHLEKLEPRYGTSIALPLEHTLNSDINPSDIYLITDGLPTLSGDLTPAKAFDKLRMKISGCGSSKSPSALVSGECRRNLFIQAVDNFQLQSKAVVNVILLPLEGDPEGAPLYQKWSSQTGGIFLSPSKDWLL